MTKSPERTSKVLEVLVYMSPKQLEQIAAVQNEIGLRGMLLGFRYGLLVFVLRHSHIKLDRIQEIVSICAEEDGLEVVTKEKYRRFPFELRSKEVSHGS